MAKKKTIKRRSRSKKEKEEEKTICLLRSQLKTLFDEARSKGEVVCDAARDLIDEIDREYPKTKKKPKAKKNLKKRIKELF